MLFEYLKSNTTSEIYNDASVVSVILSFKDRTFETDVFTKGREAKGEEVGNFLGVLCS